MGRRLREGELDMEMEAKTVRETSIVMTQIMTAQDINIAGNVHGGVIVKMIDNAAGIVAARHTKSNVVTASIDRVDFHHPAFVGDLISVKASINLVGNTSMEVGVRCESEDIMAGQHHHTASAYLTFVALDKDGKPKPIPPLILETEEEKRRNREAQARKKVRLAQRESEK